MTQQKTFHSKYNQDKIEALIEMISYKYPDLFDALDINMTKAGKLFIGTCPVHGGDNPTALSLYADGHSVKGFWKCRTKNCQKIFKQTLLGFIRGVLSRNYNGWSSPEDEKLMYGFPQTIEWMLKFVGKKSLNEIHIDSSELKKRRFISQMNTVVKQKEEVKKGVTREQIASSLKSPSYYISRGFKKETLTYFDVGLCDNPKKEMYKRIVVPIYDENHKYMVACTGRSICDKCNKCEMYHNGECPTIPNAKMIYCKWKNTPNVSHYLYNYWNAKEHIKKTGVVVIVEGPPDVWKLHELGVSNVVGLFGLDMSEEQQILLEMSGALSIIILTDMDKPGRAAIEELRKKLRSFRLVVPELSVKDPGELTNDIFEKELKPHLNKLERNYI